MEVYPSVNVLCAVCGDEVEVYEVVREEDGSLTVTVGGVCERDMARAVSSAQWEATRARRETEDRVHQVRREAETARWMQEQEHRRQEEKRKRDEDFNRLLYGRCR